MHYSMVIALKQAQQMDLIWCDSLQRDGRQALHTYAQYYHFLEMEMTRPQEYQPTRHYTSTLRIRTHTPSLSRQCNGTDCGIFTLLYQQAASNWYGAAAGQTFSDAQIRELLNALCTINQATASRHREWIRTHMHTWWRDSWEGTDPITPPGEHQRQVQQRRQRRRVQDSGLVESQPTDHSTTQSDDRNTPGLAQDPCITSATETSGRKRNQQEMGAEGLTITEIVDLVDHAAQHPAGITLEASPTQATSIPTQSVATVPGEEEAIPEWVITESCEMNREVTPPTHLFFRDQGERQDGDCGPAAAIGTLYYLYCKAGVTRVGLESLLTYRTIRQLAATHLQQQTLLEVAQVDDSQMVGSQIEVHRATQDLWTQITRWEADTDPYTSASAWVWDEIAQPESPNRNRQAVWWSDLVVALVIKAALRHLPTDPAISNAAMEAAQLLRSKEGEGTCDLMLLNAQHGVLFLADTVLARPEIQAICVHFQVIIVVSRGKHFVTYYRRTPLFTGPSEEDGRLWLQELRLKRPLVETVRQEEPAGTTRSVSQPTPHLVSYTTANKVKIAILSHSPDQLQYQDAEVAWRRIFKHMDRGHEGSTAGNTVVHQLAMERSPQTRKRGRPTGTKTTCSKPKALRGVKARRTETIATDGQGTPIPQVDRNVTHIYYNTHSNDTNTTNNTDNTNQYNHSNCNDNVDNNNNNNTNSNNNNNNDNTELVSHSTCMSSSNHNNTYEQGDSPPIIRLQSTGSAHSRNRINTNIYMTMIMPIVRTMIIHMIRTIIQISTAYVNPTLLIAI